MPNPACQQDMQEKVKSESTFFFFADRASNFVLENLSTLKQLLHVPNIILGAVDDDGDYAGDGADDNYDADANCDYDQDYEC